MDIANAAQIQTKTHTIRYKHSYHYERVPYIRDLSNTSTLFCCVKMGIGSSSSSMSSVSSSASEKGKATAVGKLAPETAASVLRRTADLPVAEALAEAVAGDAVEAVTAALARAVVAACDAVLLAPVRAAPGKKSSSGGDISSGSDSWSLVTPPLAPGVGEDGSTGGLRVVVGTEGRRDAWPLLHWAVCKQAAGVTAWLCAQPGMAKWHECRGGGTKSTPMSLAVGYGGSKFGAGTPGESPAFGTALAIVRTLAAHLSTLDEPLRARVPLVVNDTRCLVCAAIGTHAPPLLRELLAAGVSPDHTSGRTCTISKSPMPMARPLDTAVAADDAASVLALLAAGAVATDADGTVTSLALAATTRNAVAITYNKPPPFNLRAFFPLATVTPPVIATAAHGELHPLHVAVIGSVADDVEALLAAGMDADALPLRCTLAPWPVPAGRAWYTTRADRRVLQPAWGTVELRAPVATIATVARPVLGRIISSVAAPFVLPAPPPPVDGVAAPTTAPVWPGEDAPILRALAAAQAAATRVEAVPPPPPTTEAGAAVRAEGRFRTVVTNPPLLPQQLWPRGMNPGNIHGVETTSPTPAAALSALFTTATPPPADWCKPHVDLCMPLPQLALHLVACAELSTRSWLRDDDDSAVPRAAMRVLAAGRATPDRASALEVWYRMQTASTRGALAVAGMLLAATRTPAVVYPSFTFLAAADRKSMLCNPPAAVPSQPPPLPLALPGAGRLVFVGDLVTDAWGTVDGSALRSAAEARDYYASLPLPTFLPLPAHSAATGILGDRDIATFVLSPGFEDGDGAVGPPPGVPPAVPGVFAWRRRRAAVAAWHARQAAAY